MSEPLHILVVDDDVVGRAAICRAVTAAAHDARCDEAGDFDEALRLANLHAPSCVLLSDETPRSLELVAVLRAAEVRSPIVLITARAEGELEIAADAGVTDYLLEADIATARLMRRIRFAIRTGRIEAESARSLAAAQLAAHARDEVLAVVSHDLRGPLHAISLACEALHDEVKPEAVRYLGAIERAAARAERLISDLLEASAIENGALTLAIYPTDAASIVKQAASEGELLARESSTTLSVRTPDEPIAVAADRDRVLQVMANLIGNALKHARGTPITVTLERRDRNAMISVSDRGPGVPAADLPFVFDRYRRGRTKKAGAGLGLAIAKGIVAAHGGTLAVTCAPGEGATFSFTLPIASPASVAALRPASSH